MYSSTLGVFGVSVATWRMPAKFLPPTDQPKTIFEYRTLADFSLLQNHINRDFFKRLYSYAATFPLPNGISGAPVQSTIKYQCVLPMMKV